MTDDLNRLRAVTLTDDERGTLRWAIAKGYYDHTSDEKVFTAVESIVAARTAALIERAEGERDEAWDALKGTGYARLVERLARERDEASTDLAALRAAVTNLADESAPYPGDERWTVVKDETLNAALLAAAPTETEGESA